MAPARAAAYAVLLRAERGPGRLDLSLVARPELAGLTARDRALASELVSGTLKRRNSLDAVLMGFTGGRRLASVDVDVRTALRLGAFQLLYLDRVPAHAAVDDSVELAKRSSPRAGGFANAVLRRVATDGRERLAALSAGDALGAVALRTSHPQWLVRLWRRELGVDAALALLEADNEPPARCLRVNRRLGTSAEAVAALAADGITASPVEGFASALEIEGPPVETAAAFRDGLVTPQSLGSQLVAQVVLDGLGGGAGGAGGGEIADLCAAPGAKTSQLADAWPAARVVAVEADETRAPGLRANLARQRLDGVQVVVADVLSLGSEYDGRFSAVLLDPPCTGLGTLASRPDLRWRHRPTDIERLADLQRRLLERATGLVEPGGALTYSVCTLSDTETLGVVDPFLLRGGWSLDDLSGIQPRFVHPRRGGCLLTLPSRDRTSGFFIARLRRDGVAVEDPPDEVAAKAPRGVAAGHPRDGASRDGASRDPHIHSRGEARAGAPRTTRRRGDPSGRHTLGKEPGGRGENT